MMHLDDRKKRKGDRRAGDRRIVKWPIDFPERRKGDRRSGTDRRADPKAP